MLAPVDDVLALLLPRASEVERARAARVTEVLRRLVAAGYGTAPPARVDADGADRELRRERRERAGEALEDLLRLNLGACQGEDAFLAFGPAARTHHGAWTQLLELGPGHPAAVDLPAPGEAPLGVATRLLAAAPALLTPGRAALWRARHAWCAGERAAARGLWSALAEEARGPLAAEVAADRAAARLERADVRGARALLAGGEPGPDAARLAAWCRLLLGEEPGPVPDPDGPRRPVPAALVELRAERPAWRPWLAGPARVAGAAPPAPAAPRGRRALGACAFGVFVLESRSAARPLLLDLAPALAERRAAWLRARDGAWTDARAPEHELLLTARAVVRRRARGAPLRAAIGPASAALALEPIAGDDGEVVGWLHVECEHHLLPGSARLARLAAAWAPEVRGARSGPAVELGARPASGFVARAFVELADGLPMKTARRRWWGFELVDGEPRASADGGAGLRRAARPAGGCAVARALATGGVVAWDEPDPRLSLHVDTASGFATPVEFLGRPLAVFVVESSRRRDLRPEDRARIVRGLSSAALELALARFREAHQARHGRDLAFPTGEPDFAASARRIVTLARADAPVTLFGPAGVGKTILARWLHFESTRAREPLAVLRGALAPALARAAGASLLIEDAARLDGESQALLAAHLDAPGDGPRVYVSLDAAPGVLARAERLRPELARALERVAVRVPALGERRAELVHWVPALVARVAAQEERPAPRLSDDALALLWRQPWEGNLRELEDVLYKLVLLADEEELGAQQVVELLTPFGLQAGARPNSRRARTDDLLAALAATRTAGGRVNKTRAAQYLGWDPDTLVARLQERGIDPDDPPAPRPWSRPPAGGARASSPERS
jgi:hypothetical protein